MLSAGAAGETQSNAGHGEAGSAAGGTTGRPSAGQAEVVLAGDEHAELLAAFYRRIWDPAATAERVLAGRATAASDPAAGGAPPPTFLFLADGAVVGHVTSIPVRLWDGTAERPFHWVKGLMVLPEHRRGPVGFLLLREAMRHLGEAAGLVVEPEARRLFTALGFQDLGALPNHLRLLRPARVLRRADSAALEGRVPARLFPLVRLARRRVPAALAGAAVSAALRLRGLGAGGRGLTVREEAALPPAAELDALWHQARVALAAAPSRAGEILHWRYGGERGKAYSFLVARAGGLLRGCAVLRRPRAVSDPRLNGLRVATLSDLLAVPGDRDAVLSLLAGAERGAAATDADALLATASYAALEPLLRRRAYLPLGGNVHLLVRLAAAAPAPPPLGAWWLLRGDSAADDVF